MKDEYLKIYKKINSKNGFKPLVSVLLVLVIYLPLITIFSDINISKLLHHIFLDMLFFIFPILIPLSTLFVLLFFHKYYLLKFLLFFSMFIAFPFHLVASMGIYTKQDAIQYFLMFILPYIIFIIALIIIIKFKNKIKNELTIK